GEELRVVGRRLQTPEQWHLDVGLLRDEGSRGERVTQGHVLLERGLLHLFGCGRGADQGQTENSDRGDDRTRHRTARTSSRGMKVTRRRVVGAGHSTLLSTSGVIGASRTL